MKLKRLQKTRRHGGVVIRSRHEQQRPEKLRRRQPTTVYDGRPVMMMMTL